MFGSSRKWDPRLPTWVSCRQMESAIALTIVRDFVNRKGHVPEAIQVISGKTRLTTTHSQARMDTRVEKVGAWCSISAT